MLSLLVSCSHDDIFFFVLFFLSCYAQSVNPLFIHLQCCVQVLRRCKAATGGSVKPVILVRSVWTWAWLRCSVMGLCAWSARNSGEDRVDIVPRRVAHRGQGSGCSGQRDDRGAACEANTWVPAQSVKSNVHHVSAERPSAADRLLIRTRRFVMLKMGVLGLIWGSPVGPRGR